MAGTIRSSTSCRARFRFQQARLPLCGRSRSISTRRGSKLASSPRAQPSGWAFRCCDISWGMSMGPAAGYLSDSYVFNWHRQTFAGDLIFVIPIALCLGVGLAAGHPAAGMIAAGGAMTVGFGAKQSIDQSRLLPMIFASFGIAFSTFVGMIAGHDNFVLVGVAAFWAFGYGMLAGRSGGYGWVGQQCVVLLLVGSAFPFSARLAATRALLLLAGGAMQVLWASAALRLFGQLGSNLLNMARYVREEEMALRAAAMQ